MVKHMGNPAITDQTIEHRLLALLDGRDEASSICPSEVARALSDDESTWRGLMARVREVAATLQDAGRIRITRGDTAVTRSTLEDGPIRLRHAKGD